MALTSITSLNSFTSPFAKVELMISNLFLFVAIYCYFVAKVSIIIDNYKLYVGKSSDCADKWIVMQ